MRLRTKNAELRLSLHKLMQFPGNAEMENAFLPKQKLHSQGNILSLCSTFIIPYLSSILNSQFALKSWLSIIENAHSSAPQSKSPKGFPLHQEKVWKNIGGFAIMVLRVRAIRESPLQNNETRGVELAISQG